MENINKATLPVAPAALLIGQAFGGGFFVGEFRSGGRAFALILAPKEAGEREGAWSGTRKSVPGAESFNDGLANTIAMAESGSELAQWARGLEINGHADWYIPSRDELELVYRNLKPTARENYASFRDGDNPSSSPAGYPYIAAVPAQTSADAFKEGAPQALQPAWHWSSTQYAADPSDAWCQGFDGGGQSNVGKSYEGRARAVRRLEI